MRSILLLLLTLTSSPVIAVVVIGEGATLIDAQDQARRQAITQVVGAIVDTERVVANRKLVVDQILTYSAGYIVKEVILEQYPVGERFFVKLDVEVKSSKLKDFVLSQSNSNNSVFNGNDIKLQIESYNKQLTDLKTLIFNTTKHYPSKAYNLIDLGYTTKVGKKYVGSGKYQDNIPYIIINYELSWVKGYLEALEELAKIVQEPQAERDINFDGRVYQLSNNVREMFAKNLKYSDMSEIAIEVNIYNQNNETIVHQCRREKPLMNGFLSFKKDARYRGSISISNFPVSELENASRISIKVQKSCIKHREQEKFFNFMGDNKQNTAKLKAKNSCKGCDLSGAGLWKDNLRGAKLNDANLQGADIGYTDLSKSEMYNTDLRESSLVYSKFREADLRGADLRGADLRGADLEDANLSGADLRGADLQDADLEDANLSGTNLRGAKIRGANLASKSFVRAYLANMDFSVTKGTGNNNFSKANLQNANFRSKNLSRNKFNCTDLRGADLSDTDLRDASLWDADLRGADLRGADLRGAELYGASLWDTDLRGADLRDDKLFSSNTRFCRTKMPWGEVNTHCGEPPLKIVPGTNKTSCQDSVRGDD